MLLDQATVCKPLIQRELLFYLNIPPELQSYVPTYKGRSSNCCRSVFPRARGLERTPRVIFKLVHEPGTSTTTSHFSRMLTRANTFSQSYLLAGAPRGGP